MAILNTKRNLVSEIYSSLKQDILWMRLKPGAMFTEQYLANIFETSKTPVREALVRLANDNLVTVLPHKGYIVKEISFTDLHNLFQFRGILECAAIECAAQYASEAQLEQLEGLAGNLKAFYEDEPHFDYSTFSNTDFHLYLVKLAENPFLFDTFMNVIEQLQRFMWISTTDDLIEQSINEHYEMVRLIRDKKVAEAQKLMRKHINDIVQSGMDKNKKGLL
ncbi:MAG: GntR family transcriptional regulator [Clostridiaceae bacterium]